MPDEFHPHAPSCGVPLINPMASADVVATAGFAADGRSSVVCRVIATNLDFELPILTNFWNLLHHRRRSATI